MNQAIRKALLFGIGVYHLSREKVEGFVKELESEGELSPEEGKKVVDEVLQKIDVERKNISEKIEKSVHSVVKELEKEKNKATDEVKEEVEKVKHEAEKVVEKKKSDTDEA